DVEWQAGDWVRLRQRLRRRLRRRGGRRRRLLGQPVLEAPPSPPVPAPAAAAPEERAHAPEEEHPQDPLARDVHEPYCPPAGGSPSPLEGLPKRSSRKRPWMSRRSESRWRTASVISSIWESRSS